MHTKLSFASYIDHTLLKPDASPEQIEILCAQAREHSFYSVCINPFYIPLCALMTRGTNVKVCTVIGFPLGAASPGMKTREAELAVSDGAHELDMVINISALKAGDHRFMESEIKEVKKAAGGNIVLKVIVETGLLTDDEKRLAGKVCAHTGADFIKTSTGFFGGATARDVAILAKTAADGSLLVKASGGIKTLADARLMLESGASRLGTSSSLAIIEELE